MNKQLAVSCMVLLAGGALLANAQGGGYVPGYPPPANSQPYDPAYDQQTDPAYAQQYDPADEQGYADAYDPYFIPPYPGGDYVWVDGFWSPQHVWIAGYWRSPRFGVYRWSGPRYVPRAYYRAYRGGFGYLNREGFRFRSNGRFDYRSRSFPSHGYQYDRRGAERSFRGGSPSFRPHSNGGHNGGYRR